MKKRVAVFANGWGCEYLREVVMGAYEVAAEADIDIFSFVDFSTMADTAIVNKGEINIFKLPDLHDFDGVILMANSFNMKEEETYMYEKVMASGIPCISVEYEFEGITTINTDNYAGMYQLTKHIIEDHGARRIVYFGGPQEHPENQIRLSAVLDVASENGVVIRDEDILYCDWAKVTATKTMEQWLKENEELPDVFICANDTMALGIADCLKDHGYSIPRDIMITGYDCTTLGQEYDPPITSVSHEWFNMGIKTMQILFAKMEGRDCGVPETMKTRMVCGGSCGCAYDRNKISDWDEFGRNPYYKKTEGFVFDSHFRHMYLAARKAESADMLNESFNFLFTAENWMESDNFMLCLEPEFFRIVENDDNLRIDGYSEKVDVICSLHDGKAREHEILPYRKAMFRVAEENAYPGIYIFVPLSGEGTIYGFAMLARDMDIVLENYLYSWTRHMNQYLEHIRRNMMIADLTQKLTVLSVTDVLTGVYNRAGCEKMAYPMLNDIKNAGETGVLMIADIDRMKVINDKYGHACGDLALRSVASVLRLKVPSDWIVARFGGDEFLLSGKMRADIDLKELVESITKELQAVVEREKFEFHLSISIGHVVIDPDSDFDVETSLREADQLMYLVKEGHHKKIDQENNA